MDRLKFRYRLLSVLFCATILSCQVKVPPVADLDPIYQLPEISLAQKETFLAMLRTCKAIGDEKCANEYDRLVLAGAGEIIAENLGELGYLYAWIGRENAFGHFSDDQAIYTNAFTLDLNADETDEDVLLNVEFALEKM